MHRRLFPTPQNLDGIFFKNCIRRHQDHAFILSLGHQHAVKWVIVHKRQFTKSKAMGVSNRQRPHPELRKSQVERFTGGPGQRELASGNLDYDLPGNHGGKKDFFITILQDLPCAGVQSLLVVHAPQQNSRIEKIFHARLLLLRGWWAFFTTRFSGSSSPRKPARMSGGKGPLKSSAIQISPFRNPRGRLPCSGYTGTSFATGTPALAIMTSSPRATRCNSLEKLVFASCTLISIRQHYGLSHGLSPSILFQAEYKPIRWDRVLAPRIARMKCVPVQLSMTQRIFSILSPRPTPRTPVLVLPLQVCPQRLYSISPTSTNTRNLVRNSIQSPG